MVRSADRPNRFWGLDDTWQWLEQANLDRGAVVNLDWASPGAGGQIPFGTALHWILSDRAVLYTSLNFTLDHGVVVVSTDTDLSKHRLPVVYNIRDLIDIATATQPKASRQDAIDELKSLIMDTIARDSWDENGGNVGSLSEMGDVLVITQTLASQRQILELLTTLRRTSRSRPAQPAMVNGDEPPITPSVEERPAVVLKIIEKFQPDDGATYLSAIQALADQAGMKIHVNWQSVARFMTTDPAGSLDHSLPIEHVSFAEAVRRILVPDENIEALNFRMTGDVVVVSIDQVTQIYNVRDLANAAWPKGSGSRADDELVRHNRLYRSRNVGLEWRRYWQD